MFRDPYSRPWGERLFFGLLALLVAAIALNLLARFIAPLIPPLTLAVVVAGLLLWILTRNHT